MKKTKSLLAVILAVAPFAFTSCLSLLILDTTFKNYEKSRTVFTVETDPEEPGVTRIYNVHPDCGLAANEILTAAGLDPNGEVEKRAIENMAYYLLHFQGEQIEITLPEGKKSLMIIDTNENDIFYFINDLVNKDVRYFYFKINSGFEKERFDTYANLVRNYENAKERAAKAGQMTVQETRSSQKPVYKTVTERDKKGRLVSEQVIDYYTYDSYTVDVANPDYSPVDQEEAMDEARKIKNTLETEYADFENISVVQLAYKIIDPVVSGDKKPEAKNGSTAYQCKVNQVSQYYGAATTWLE